MKQLVHLSIMDSARPPLSHAFELVELSLGRRITRTVLRLALVSGVSAIVMLLPLLHLCGALGVLLAGPIAAAFVFRVSVLTEGRHQVACPKCAAGVEVMPRSTGWPLRAHCEACGSSIVGQPAPTPSL